MLNLNKETFKRLQKLYLATDIEQACEDIRHGFTLKGEDFSIFTMLSQLDTNVILFDDKEETNTRYISFSDGEDKNYMVLSADRTVEEMRFDAACMFAKIAKKIYDTKKETVAPNYTTLSKKFSREEKHFACALLMPKKELMRFITQKDENGNYIYLDENNEISFKNINAVADHFGVPFNQCSSRIFHVLEDQRKATGKVKYGIKGCRTKAEYQKMKKEYTQEQREKDMKEVVPNHEENRQKLINHLLDSLHYRSWSRLSDIAKRRLLTNLVKADSVNEGVVRSEEEATKIINDYIASGGTITGGKLVTQSGSFELTDDQLVVLGEYDLYQTTLEEGLIAGLAKSSPWLSNLTSMDYKDAINSLKERDIANYICDLHRALFSKLSHKYGDERGGRYRTAPVKLSGTSVSTADPYMIPQLVENLSWRILDILKKNANGELSNSEYIDKVNGCIYEMIRMQPFSDGNKRTSRLLSNILYQEKGIPYVLVPVKYWDKYVDAWSNRDVKEYNKMMHELIVESYQYFYGKQSVHDITVSKSYGKKIINTNRKRKV